MADDPDGPDFMGSYRTRLYVNAQLISNTSHEVTSKAQMDQAATQAMLLMDTYLRSPEDVWLVEIELLGSDDPERFIRFGTDTGGMIDPIQLPGSPA